MGTEFFDELGETLSRTAKGLSERAESLYETQKIRNKISAEERAVEKIMAELGKILYRRYRDGEEFDGELAELCGRADEHRNAVKEYKKELADRKGKKVCPSCQKEVDKDVAYCPYCGSACPNPEPETEAPEPEEEAPAEAETEEAAAPEAEGEEAGGEETAAGEESQETEENASAEK